MQKVDAAYAEGRISLDQKVLYKFYAGLKPEKLPSRFKSGENKVVKCGTPAHIEYKKNKTKLAASTIAEIESLTEPPTIQAQATYLSPSGKFLLHYETSGNDAVPTEDENNNSVPDYIEQTAAAADSSWRHEVNTLRYTDPIESTPYNIYFKNFDLYGLTSNGDLPYPCGSQDKTCIYIHNNFIDFPPNTDPEGDVKGAIKVTMAHELKHAINFVINNWDGETTLWEEMDATLMEEVVYDNVNDYYNYLTNSSSIFQNPEESFYPGSYYHVSWALYFEQKYGPDFWPNVWNRIEQDPTNIEFTGAMSQELGGSEAFRQAYIESHLWHLASGPDSQKDYGFEERENYPQASTNSGTEFLTNDFAVPRKVSRKQLNKFSAKYYKILPDNSVTGELLYELIPSENTDMGLIAFLKDGKIGTQIFLNADVEKGKIFNTNWSWEKVRSLGIVLANPSIAGSAESPFLLVGANNPDKFTLSQNYPNPFNPTTEIRFSLQQQTQVQLNVYDITGRLIRTLVEETLPAGIYQETFEGADLASGVYFYRLVTDQKVLSKKMTLIK